MNVRFLLQPDVDPLSITWVRSDDESPVGFSIRDAGDVAGSHYLESDAPLESETEYRIDTETPSDSGFRSFRFTTGTGLDDVAPTGSGLGLGIPTTIRMCTDIIGAGVVGTVSDDLAAPRAMLVQVDADPAGQGEMQRALIPLRGAALETDFLDIVGIDDLSGDSIGEPGECLGSRLLDVIATEEGTASITVIDWAGNESESTVVPLEVDEIRFARCPSAARCSARPAPVGRGSAALAALGMMMAGVVGARLRRKRTRRGTR